MSNPRVDAAVLHGSEFRRTPLACRIWVTSAVAGALLLPSVSPDAAPHAAHSQLLTGGLLVSLSILNIEIGRIVEGGASDSQRPHKGLSAWAFAAAILLPAWWLLPVEGVTYAHAWWRGLRVPPWKWVGSAAYVVLAGLGASIIGGYGLGTETDLMQGDGLSGVVVVLAAAAAFIAIETVLFHGSAYLNHPDDEVWLRHTLRSPSFYLTEGGVLLVGGLSAAIWTGGGWFVVLLVPVYAITQRAALYEPLRQRAEHDGKTGLLRFESWRRLAIVAAARCHRSGRPWAVLFADLDHFKAFNDRWGHLGGDEALSAVAKAMTSQLRARDLAARFGGEEFCVFLPDLGPEEATAVAERIRTAVASAEIRGRGPVRISIGLAVADSAVETNDFGVVLSAADRALFCAKERGRDQVRVEIVDVATLPDRVPATAVHS
ncbi:MAG: diguanylate cyclase [Marmoricola sp.]